MQTTANIIKITSNVQIRLRTDLLAIQFTYKRNHCSALRRESRENPHKPSESLCERIRAAIMAAADYLELTLRQVEGMARQICRLRDSRRRP